MSKKKNQGNPQPTAVKKIRTGYLIINKEGPVPIAKPSYNIQLTPIVQPIALTPFSTQNQPVKYMEEEDDEF